MWEQFQAMDPLLRTFIAVFALLLVWSILRALLRLATKIFSLGCAVIILIGGLILLLSNWEALFGGG